MLSPAKMRPHVQPPRDQLTEDEVFQYVLGVMDRADAEQIELRARVSANVRAQITVVRHLLGDACDDFRGMNHDGGTTERLGD